MAQSCDFHINGAGIEWKIVLPSSYGHSRSPTFALLGSEWRLDFMFLNRKSTCIVVAMNPVKCEGYGGTLSNPFEVVTYLRDPRDNSRTALNLTWRNVTKRERVDFAHSHDVIRTLSDVRIVCLFYGAYPTTESKNLNEKSVQVSSEAPRDIETFSSDFSHLLEDEILPDVRLECGGRTFRAHRSVLAARSQVFRAMFQTEMLERESGAVKIPDIDAGVLEKLLKYVYTGKPEDITEDTVAPLYEAADKYDVHSLKTACTYWMVRNLTVENCVKYLVVTDSHSDGDLKSTVLTFVLKNPSVLKSEAWLAFSKEPSKLAIEVLQAYVSATVQ